MVTITKKSSNISWTCSNISYGSKPTSTKHIWRVTDFITQCYKIIIENSDKTLKAISEEFDIKYDLVKRLNSGSSHKRNCFLYPIKDNKEYNKNQINL